MMGVSQMLLAVMKSMEQTKISAQISAACLLSNIVLNAVSIYALFPNDPYEALCGVALSTSLGPHHGSDAVPYCFEKRKRKQNGIL